MPSGWPDIRATLKPIRTEAFGRDEARRLLWRAGYGGSPAQERALAENNASVAAAIATAIAAG